MILYSSAFALWMHLYRDVGDFSEEENHLMREKMLKHKVIELQSFLRHRHQLHVLAFSIFFPSSLLFNLYDDFRAHTRHSTLHRQQCCDFIDAQAHVCEALCYLKF